MGTPANKLTGGFVNYYLVKVPFPQRVEQPPYQAECEDIAEALKLTPDEFNIFKAIWRGAAARLGNGKPDSKAEYDAEKMLHYSKRHLRSIQIANGNYPPKQEPIKEDEWIEHSGDGIPPEIINGDEQVMVMLRSGSVGPDAAHRFRWEHLNTSCDIIKWRRIK